MKTNVVPVAALIALTGQASAAERPNVWLCVDDLRAESGCFGIDYL